MIVPNPTIVIRAVPTELPIPEEHFIYKEDETIDIGDHVSLQGGVLVKTVALSVDPYLRNVLRDSGKPGNVMKSIGIGRVLRSDDPSFKVGDHVRAWTYPWSEYAILDPKQPRIAILKNPSNLPWHKLLSALGMPAQTAWCAYKAFAKAQKGETIYVSSAAGTVGSIVCQIAKADGLKVIASAGTDEKIKYLKEELGVDHAFNYKTRDVGDALAEYGPVDIYWDSVGGKALETAIDHLNNWGRIILCGYISSYNAEPYGIKNTQKLLGKNAVMSAFMIWPLMEKYGDFDFDASMSKLVEDGTVKVSEQISTHLKDAPQLLLDLQLGKNTGKPVIDLSGS